MGALCCCLRSKPADEAGATETKQKSPLRTTAALQGTMRTASSTHITHRCAASLSAAAASNTLSLSTAKGPAVVVTAPNTVSGMGTVLGNSQLLQNRTYWEVHIDALPPGSSFCIGVTSNPKDDLASPLSSRPSSFALSSTHPSILSLQAGDVLGLFYDLSGVKTMLGFSINGRREASLTIGGIKGDVYPAISVEGGAVVRAVFDVAQFKFAEEVQKTGFEAPIRVRSVM